MSKKEELLKLTSVKIANKYAQANGCDNCWGDLHQGCTAECTASMKKWGQCIEDIEFYAKQTAVQELEKLRNEFYARRNIPGDWELEAVYSHIDKAITALRGDNQPNV